jgi:hypothetical protein
VSALQESNPEFKPPWFHQKQKKKKKKERKRKKSAGLEVKLKGKLLA